jgi:transcription elongation factor Elf1
MRQNGVHAVIASCEACGQKADVNVDAPPASLRAPQIGQRMQCSQCGAKKVNTRPPGHKAQRPVMGQRT